jgi:filamentous hemagglutinin family protein
MRSIRRNIEKNKIKQRKFNKKLNRIVFSFGFSTAMAFMINGSAFADVTFPQAAQLDANVTTNVNGDTFQIKHGAGSVFDNSWNSFDVPTAKTVDFNFSQNGQVSINRVVGNQASQILGRITESGASGKVFLINPHGVLFGKDSSVNLGSFAVSTANLTSANFEKGIYKFEQGNIPASIVNAGNIKVSDEGFIALMAPVVKNEGTIEAKQGTIGLVSGNKYTLTTGSGQDVSIKVDDALSKNLVDTNEVTLISNKGTVKADGGSVIISSKAMDDVIQNAVNNEGLISANSVSESNGQIVLGNINIDTNKNNILDGTIEASGAKGGNININAGSIAFNGILATTGLTQTFLILLSRYLLMTRPSALAI